MEAQFAPALSRLQSLLTSAARDARTPIHFALIGGLSLAAWGTVRATQDIDFLADSEPSPLSDVKLRERIEHSLRRQRCDVEWRVGAHDDPVPLLLRIELPRSYGRLGSDVLWAHKRWHREAFARIVNVKLSRRPVPVLHPEDLILLKLEAGGPQDLADVSGLLNDPPSRLNLKRLNETAARLRLGRMLEKCLRELKHKL